MTEFEWLAHGDPRRLLEILRDVNPSDRKMRLFICACCRAFLAPTADERLREAIDVGERYADGLADKAERDAALAAADQASRAVGGGILWMGAAVAANVPAAAAAAMTAALDEAADPAAERFRQCAILRDLFGNPFRPRRLEAAWLRWNDRAVPRLARAQYDDGRFVDLPILADALEEAGCDDAELVGHCRGDGHVRGCWAVDLLLGQV